MSLLSQGTFSDAFRKMEDQSTFICLQCVRDSWLRLRVRKFMAEQTCMACDARIDEGLTLELIASQIRDDLPKHFIADDDLYPGYGIDLGKVISRAIGCDSDSACDAVATILADPEAKEEDFYWLGQEYRSAPSPFDSAEDQRDYVVSEWKNITHELTRGRRFFNNKAHVFFEDLLAEAVNAKVPDQPGSHVAITILSADMSFYRARIANDPSVRKAIQDTPKKNLGAPPRELAINGRMNPVGIPLLYVADTPDTAIAETQPSINDTIAVGRFQSTKKLTFFDFTKFTDRFEHEPLSLFAPGYQKRMRLRELLNYLHEEIAKPVKAKDTDYVATQALAEFIQHEGGHRFDGIIYRSVQHGSGINYALFDKSDPASKFAPDWRAEFDVVIVPDAVTFYSVQSLQYIATLEAPRGIAR